MKSIVKLVVSCLLILIGIGMFSAFSNLHNSVSSPFIDRDIWRDVLYNLEKHNLAVENSLQNKSAGLQSSSILNKPDSKGNKSLLIPMNGLVKSPFDDTTKKAVKDSISRKKDTLNIKLDSLKGKKDTVKVDLSKLDSTARLKYFKTKRRDVPYISLYNRKTPSFYAQSTSKKRTIDLDSSGKFVEVKELIGSEKTKIILRIPLELYLKLKLGAREKELWDELAFAYTLKASSKELGEFIKNITDFEIPLPKVGVLSIFGPPVISLKIGGAVDIRAAWRNETTEGITASNLGNTRNEPDFKQQVQINVNGTIGDKLQILADWNTERTFEYENQLKIKYTGYEDEIIQSIEAGNVSLQGSGLVGGSEALFGIKANFKIGPLNLTTILSQKKAEVKEKQVSGGSSSQTFSKRVYEYSTNHYFLDGTYADTSAEFNFFNKYYANATPIVNPNYKITNIEVWKSITQSLHSPDERNANAYMELPPTYEKVLYPDTMRSKDVNEVPGEIVKGRFIKLTPDVDYSLHEYTGFITFKTQIQDNDVVAVAYRQSGNPQDKYFGEFLNFGKSNDTAQRLVLKLVKPANLQPQLTKAWQLLLKNIYPLSGRNVKQEGFEFSLKYEVEGSEPQIILGDVKLLTAFGLDLVGPSGTPPPDGLFDFRPGITIMPETGEIIFPTLQPFGRNMPANIPNYDSLKYLSVYDQSLTFARNDKLKDKWMLTGKYSGEASSIYQLGFNMVENSVKVFLGGRELTAGVDYTVDYNIGQLTIRNDAALTPGANLKITYEENDLFQMASKTLLGARGIFDISKRTKLGFSALTLTQQTLSDKVRIGEEPLSNSIFGVDFSTSADLPFLTKLIDKAFSTREMSTISFTGEAAYMKPDPNTKKSNISSDIGKSIAYIDDFEGSKRTIPVGIQYAAWKDLSPPDSIYADEPPTRLEKMRRKGHSWWFNYLPSDVRVEQIWPLKRVARGDEQVTVLDFAFNPDTMGTYNSYPNPDLGDPKKSWGGMMKVLSSSASNLVDENIEFIEFWLRVRSASQDSKIYIDLGKISEDVIPNNKLDTEDKYPQNDLIDEGEDTGIDGMMDAQEQVFYGLSPTDPNYADPSGDNFEFTNSGGSNDIYRYYKINGTQGNAQLTDLGRIPDTEDLNRNGVLDQNNSYYRYEVPIDTNRQTNKFIQGGGNNDKWYLYRIPLKDYKTQFGKPSFTLVEYIRLWVTGVDDVFSIRLADFNLVGNQWRKAVENDTVLSISVVNIEDNPNYSSPPGVQRERDNTRPDQEIFRNEQAMNLILQGLQVGENRDAVKYLYRPLDVFNYSEMKLFIHGDDNPLPGSVSYTNGGQYSAEVAFRFGTDTNNYYEYRQPVVSGWNEIGIIFKDLTALKQTRDSVNMIFRIPVKDKPGHFYIVKGNPTLTAVKFLSVSIVNKASAGTISGEVWVNELRVIGADDTPGWAYTASGSIKFADLLTINGNFSQTDPYFHRLAERFGNRVESKNWGFSADLDVIKLLPFSLPGSSLRVNYSRTESIGNPLFLPGTDIKVDEASTLLRDKNIKNGMDPVEADKKSQQLKDDSQTLNTSDSWTLSNLQIKIPIDYWLIRDSFNSLTYGFNYNKTFSRNPSTLSAKSWIWNANVNYGINLSPDYVFTPAEIPYIGSIFKVFDDYKEAKIFYTPQNFAWNLTARRSQSLTQTRAQGLNLSQESVSRDFQATRGFSLNWKLTDKAFLNISTTYSVDIASSLTYLETDEANNERTEGSIWKDIFTGQMFGKDFRFGQNFDLKTAPRLPSLWDINKYFNLTAGYNVRYNWNNDFRQVDVGRSAGFSNRSSAGLKLRWKALTDPLFAESIVKQETTVTEPVIKERRRNYEDEENKNVPIQQQPPNPAVSGQYTDSTKVIPAVVKDTVVKKPSALTNAYYLLKAFARTLLFDYENISIDFSNDNTVASSGLRGEGNGFSNFWGLKQNENEAPSRSFMLGLTNEPGRRAINGNLTDNFSQKNNIDIRTSRPLWEGAKIDINWKVGWSFNKSTSLASDEFGNVAVQSISATGSTNRSFLSLPPTFIFSVFKSGIKTVSEKYDPASANPSESLSKAFVEGFETMPILGSAGFMKDFMNFIPRPNWRITWDGLEKYSIFKSFTKRVSIEHAYSGEYSEGWRINNLDGNKEIQSQKIFYNFAPLLRLNITFNSLWGGNFTGSVNYNTRTGYDLGTSTRNITESLSREIGITLNYNKSGFELPIFGLSLKNDIEFSFSYTNTKNSSIVYDMEQFKEDGVPQNGTNSVSYEPRIKYVISSRVTLSIFYKRVQTTPEGAARIPPTTRNEAGLDIRISIQ